MRFLSKCFLVAATTLLVVSAASAATLFSNLGQPFNGGLIMNSTNYLLATDFLTGGTATTISNTTLGLFNQDDIDHSFTASLFTDNAGVPSTLVGSFAAFTVPANSVGNYTTNSTGINLAANTAYWEVLQMNEALDTSFISWAFTNSTGTDAGSSFSTISATQIQFSQTGGASWGNDGTGNTKFSLATVPEPTIATSLIMGIGMLLGKRRRTN